MGYVNTISYDKFPKQSNKVGKRVLVTYHYELKDFHLGTVIRDDTEEPHVMIIKLDNGNTILSTECQYRFID